MKSRVHSNIVTIETFFFDLGYSDEASSMSRAEFARIDRGSRNEYPLVEQLHYIVYKRNMIILFPGHTEISHNTCHPCRMTCTNVVSGFY